MTLLLYLKGSVLLLPARSGTDVSHFCKLVYDKLFCLLTFIHTPNLTREVTGSNIFLRCWGKKHLIKLIGISRKLTSWIIHETIITE